MLELGFRIDIRDQLRAITTPTLVFHMKNDRVIPFDLGREVAAGIPGATLIPIVGFRHWPSQKVVREIYDRTLAFLTADTPELREEELPGDTVTVAFYDIVESTSLTREMGNAAFRTRARAVQAQLKEIVQSHGGNVVRGVTLGDGLLAVFTSASSAVMAALSASSAASASDLPIRVGLHAGEVIVERDTVYGDVVNVAARIADKAKAGTVYLSAIVCDLVGGSEAMNFSEVGRRKLKGVNQTFRLFQATSPIPSRERA